MAISGNYLYVANFATNMVGEYNATTGAAIPGFSISGLEEPCSMAISGNNLYIINEFTNTVAEYNATTGAAISGFTSPSGLDDPRALAISTVPEPGPWALVAIGLVLLIGMQFFRNSDSLKARHLSA
jgi:DNA-binding beta-propeller fold protein YncE